METSSHKGWHATEYVKRKSMLSECPWYHSIKVPTHCATRVGLFLIKGLYSLFIRSPNALLQDTRTRNPSRCLLYHDGSPSSQKDNFIYFSVVLVNLHFLCLPSLLPNRVFICQFPIKTNPQTYINVSFSEGFRDSHVRSSPALLPYLNLGFWCCAFPPIWGKGSHLPLLCLYGDLGTIPWGLPHPVP